MSFANHNILDIALSIIPPTVVQIRKNLGVAANKFGQVGATYSDWLEVYGIVQPGGESNEHVEGVDISKKHVTIWLRGVALDGTHIQWAPDQIRFVGKIFNVISVDDWYPYDNYRKCECVEALNLGANQREAPPPKPKKTTPRKRVVSKKENTPQPVLPLEATIPQRNPSIFKADDSASQSVNVAPEATVVAEKATEQPPKPKVGKTLVGKARIRL